jgi:protein-S-isoprenylcysteine O-methyltransferase Ste14
MVILVCVLFSRGAPSGLLTRQVVPRGIPERLAGVSITMLGLSLSVCARKYLGRYWSSRPAIKVDHKLIRTGPYRLVRHPIYTGILVGFLGTAIAMGRVWALLLVLVILCSFLLKIRAEEKLLLEEFGEAYSQYKKEVKALIPFVV